MADTLLFLVGLTLVVLGAELLVRGASRMARLFRVPPLIVGLTVVAYGTSAPELFVSVRAALHGNADLAFGNVIGSNIFNVLFILGVAALVAPLSVQSRLVRFDVPLMIVASFLLFGLAFNGRVSRIDGLLLLAGLAAYTAYTIRQGRRETAPVSGATSSIPTPSTPSASARSALLVAAGLAGLVFGARWLVDGALGIAAAIGVGELVIGLLAVAAGTSVPELVTSIIAAIRGERDIAVGNVVGSNMFNILGVQGAASAVTASGVAVDRALLSFDLPIMIAVALACLPIFWTGYRIARWEAALFVLYFLAYVCYLLLRQADHASLPLFSAVMAGFALPLTGITLLVIVTREVLRRRRGDGGPEA